MTEPRTAIIINLDESREAGILSEGVIHFEAEKQFIDAIKEVFQRINEVDGINNQCICPDFGNFYLRTHDVITVYGSRGSGKTTFLVNMLNKIENGNSNDPDYAVMRHIHCLGIIDPTLMASRENVFKVILARITKEVDKHRRDWCCPSDPKEGKGKYDDWLQSFKKLARGIRRMGIGEDGAQTTKVDWEDDVHLLREGVEDAREGKDLEERFHHFVRESLKYLGKEAFILGLDDIDTKFKVGWDVLEVLRKFMTTPRLIVALSGDMELYTTLVEKAQWEQLGLDFKSDKEATERFEDMVSTLVDQYLQKIMGQRYRIRIAQFDEFYRDKAMKVHVTSKKREGKDGRFPKEVKDVVRTFIREMFFAYTEGDIRQYERVFVNVPVRKIIRLLEILAKATDPVEKNEAGSAVWEPNEVGREWLVPALCNLNLSALLRLGYTASDVEDIGSRKSFLLLLKRLNQHDILKMGVGLRPEYGESWKNAALATLGAAFCQVMRRNPALYLEYMLKVCLPGMLWQSDAVAPDAKFDEISEFLRLDIDESAMQTARRALGLIRSAGFPGRQPVALGTVQIYAQSKVKDGRGLVSIYYDDEQEGDLKGRSPYVRNFERVLQAAKLSGGSSSFKYKINLVDSFLEGITSWHSKVAGMAFSRLSSQGSEYSYLSVFNLLGAVTSSLNAEESDIPRLLNILSQVRAYPVFRKPEPIGAEASAGDQPGGSEDDGLDTLGSESMMVPQWLAKAMMGWRNGCSQKEKTIGLSPNLLARAFTRFFYALARIDESFGKQDVYVGRYLHRCLVAFFNSILVEEYLASGDTEIQKISLDLRNPVRSDNILLNNMAIFGLLKDVPGYENVHQKILNAFPVESFNGKRSPVVPSKKVTHSFSSENFPLFKLLFSCPLFGMFMRPPVREYIDVKANIWNQHIEYARERINTENKAKASPGEFSEVTRGDYWKEMSVTYLGEARFINLFVILNTLAVPNAAVVSYNMRIVHDELGLTSQEDMELVKRIKNKRQKYDILIKAHKDGILNIIKKHKITFSGKRDDLKKIHERIFALVYKRITTRKYAPPPTSTAFLREFMPLLINAGITWSIIPV